MRIGEFRIGRWVARWGFAALVGIAGMVALLVGATVQVPVDVPGVALQAATVYRLEVGGAIFVGLYLGGIAFVLALQNRGFTEFGSTGIRAEKLDKMSDTVAAQEDSVRLLSKLIHELEDCDDARDEQPGT